MRKKTTDFINGLHKFVVSDAQFRRDTAGKTAIQIQTKIRPLILRYWIQVSSSHGEQVLLLGRAGGKIREGSEYDVREPQLPKACRGLLYWCSWLSNMLGNVLIVE